MRSNVAAIIALVFFILLAGGSGWWAYSGYTGVARARDPGPAGLRFQLDDAEQEFHNKKDELEGNVEKKKEGLLQQLAAKKIEEREAYAKKLATQFDNLNRRREADNYLRQATIAKNWSATVTAAPNVTKDLVAPVKAEIDKQLAESQKANADQIKEIIEKTKAINDESTECKAKAAKEIADLEAEKRRLKNERDAKRGEIERLSSRETLGPVALPPVGRVLISSAETKTTVINLGSRVGIKRGMRFEIYQVRYGNTRVHKGYLEVKSVEPEVSTCTILVHEVRLPRCPNCGYTAAQPEDLYCPRCTAPGSTQNFQRLSDSPKVVTVGQSDTDPVVKGDLLYNPLFTLKPGTRYVVAGEPLVERRDYDVPHLVKTIEFYGGTIEKELTSETDVLVALRGAKKQVQDAEDLGIPIVREFELFRYLER